MSENTLFRFLTGDEELTLTNEEFCDQFLTWAKDRELLKSYPMDRCIRSFVNSPVENQGLGATFDSNQLTSMEKAVFEYVGHRAFA